ncbi:hypothetical protein kuro4_10100 [Gelria sp. Kuro-4]|nr:hypothetical protein kuro4_10100 [Gelria sp. Kuro-4]
MDQHAETQYYRLSDDPAHQEQHHQYSEGNTFFDVAQGLAAYLRALRSAPSVGTPPPKACRASHGRAHNAEPVLQLPALK